MQRTFPSFVHCSQYLLSNRSSRPIFWMVVIHIGLCLFFASCAWPNGNSGPASPTATSPSRNAVTTPVPLSTPIYPAGWRVLATFRGTGSQTISTQPIAVPHLWQGSLDCLGTGRARAQFMYSPHGSLTAKTDTCDIGPDASPRDVHASARIINKTSSQVERITVTTEDKSTIWLLQVVACVATDATCEFGAATPTTTH